MWPYAILLPALLAQDSKPIPLREAVDELMDRFDLTGTLEGAKPAAVSKRDQPSLRWLLACGQGAPSTQPFPKGHPSQKEAQILLTAMGGQTPTAPDMTLREPGSQVAYWRWGARLVRRNIWSREQRRAWEDRLLEPGIHPVLQGHALRHALCFALAEQDGDRFAEVKARLGDEARDTLMGFQAAMALQGALAPELRLWSLPDLEPSAAALAQPGIRRIWIAQMPQEGTHSIDAPTLWIIPTQEGAAPPDREALDQDTRNEVLAMIPRLPKAPGRLWLVPTQKDLAKYGLLHFPIEILLDSQGRVTRILMGDAALAAGHSALTGPKPLG